MEKEKGVTYNIVDSVKGGCGKTTFSIMLAMALNWRSKQERENVCLIDMDLQGTALEYLLFGERKKPGEDGKPEIYLNEKVSHYDKKEKKYIAHFTWNGKDKAVSRFGVILSSPNQCDKNKYKAVSSQNYSPEVLYSTFRMGLKHLLGKEELLAQGPYLYEHIIFDMPPNSDGYSDAVYDCMLKKDYTVLSEKDRCNLFIVLTLDQSQRLATVNYFLNFMAREDGPKINKIFFVFNNYPYTSDDGYKERLEEAVRKLKDSLAASISLKEQWEKRIFFVGIHFFKEFFDLCIERDGIKNGPQPEGLINPVCHIYDFKIKELSDSETKELIPGTEALITCMREEGE